MKLSTRMLNIGWSIIKIGDTWVAKSIAIDNEFNYTDGKWDESPIPLLELEELCFKFDWTWPMSDDGHQYDKGKKAQALLERMIELLELDNEDIKNLQTTYCNCSGGCYKLYV